MNYQEFVEFLTDRKDFSCGLSKPDKVAWEWCTTGIPFTQCAQWIEAGTFEPLAALAMVREDLEPKHAAVAAGYGGEEKTVGYWLSNGDYSIKDVVTLLAIQGEIDRASVPWVA